MVFFFLFNKTIGSIFLRFLQMEWRFGGFCLNGFEVIL